MSENRPPGCEGCKEPKTIHLTQIINGVMHKFDMCPKCPNAKKIDDPTGFSLADQLMGLGAGEEIQSSEEDSTVCPKCSFTQPDFKKSGRLGCPHCYETFSEGLATLLKNMHRGTQHKGKVPRRFVETSQMIKHIEDLQEELKRAVTEENFEVAAAIRDQIRALESRLPK